MKKNVALIRMDRMGDLMCTLPVDQNYYNLEQFGALDHSFSFVWVISQNLGFILENAEPLRTFKEWPLEFSVTHFRKFIKFCRQFDSAIVFHAPVWVSIALFIARVPHRFGPQSKLYQLLFLNHTLKQRRSSSTKHEADYNLELFNWAIGKHQESTPLLRFRALPLPTHSLLPSPQKPYIVIHPGMGGSALNWPQFHYIKLMQSILRMGYLVVITGTDSDLRWLTEISGFAQKEKNVRWLVGQLSGVELLTVLSNAEAVVAPSTGVVHLAAACGVKTLGLYSPIKVQSATRWAPRGPLAQTLSPNVICPGQNKCEKKECARYSCLRLIEPDEVVRVLSLTNNSKT